MSSPKQISETFNSMVIEIERKLLEEIREKFDESVKKKKTENAELKEFQARQNTLNILLQETQAEIKHVEAKIEAEMKYMHIENDPWYKQNRDFCSYFISYVRTPEIHFLAVQDIFQTKEGRNLSAFRRIVKDTKNLISLAVNSKEVRNIVLSFQSKNWRALGIELPAQSLYSSFDITEDGSISIPELTAPSTAQIQA